jgi:hypothetical protein
MKILIYLFGITAGFWAVLYISPLVFFTADLLQHIIGMMEQF